ncbi:FecCD family ABC transporter permease [Devosia nitrariae]|uniref:Siderophore ABC transporter permease n=1 Tax=Devosia nitrariae TaxID=2071872 RepID=A0ABQ5WAV6_9HYPH|nr:iron ABC transporter permease [Devosia nitrariae]GLQ56776.1 siderophore ABC transporter permease [Devosia nitrariae]
MATYGALATGLLLVMAASLTLGYRIYSLDQVARALFAFDGTETSVIIANLRLPRAVVAPMVGAALGIAGVLVQTLSRNRIASPDTLGLNAGASLSVVMASSVVGVSSLMGLSLAAALGALLAALLVFGIAATAGGLSPLRIVLVGVTFAGLGHSVVEVVLTTNEAQMQQLLFWLSGAFVDRPLALAANGAPFMAAGALIALVLSRALDALQADDSTAASLGVPLFLVRGAAFLSVSLLTGASVAMAGPVGFVGLVVPHAARRLVGLRHSRQIVAAALIGAVYTTAADVAARFVIYPVEAPVGAVTAVVGGVVLFVLLRRRAA